MTAGVLDAQQDRLATAGGSLETRSHLAGLPRSDARIVPSGGHHHRGILGTVTHVMIGVHRVKVFESFQCLRGAKLGDIRRTIGSFLAAYGIRHADPVKSRGKQIWPLGDRAADRDPTRAGTLSTELCC